MGFKIGETALLVVDVTNSYCHSKCEPDWVSFKAIRRMVPSLEKFVSKYRAAGGCVVFVLGMLAKGRLVPLRRC